MSPGHSGVRAPEVRAENVAFGAPGPAHGLLHGPVQGPGIDRWFGGWLEVAVAALASLFFLSGGVATYVEPVLTPPAYIVGSSLMLGNAGLAAQRGLQRRRSPARVKSPVRARLAWLLLALVVLPGAFSLGYLGRFGL